MTPQNEGLINQLKEILPPIIKVVPNLKKKTANELAGPCPFCAGKDRFVIFMDSERFLCRGCTPKGGDLIDFYCKTERTDIKGLIKKYLDKQDTPKRLITEAGRRIHLYTDSADKPTYRKTIVKYADGTKSAFFERYEAEAWVKGLGTIKQTLYNLPGLKILGPVYISESEKDADLLIFQGIVATAFGGSENWHNEYADYLAGREIIILPHHDAPGIRAAERVARDLKTKGCNIRIISPETWGPDDGHDVSDWFDDGHNKAELEELVVNTSVWEPMQEGDPAPLDGWKLARKLFPRIPFPWEILPSAIGRSLQQLARSHATTPDALPGVAFCIMASLIGSTIHVQAKSSWKEPLVFWLADIRGSGAGKTPPARALCRVLYEEQDHANEAFEKALKEWQKLKSKEKSQRDKPERARGYYSTELTLEGLRNDVSGHGGHVAIFDEVSSFLGAQNQYKHGGTDRESWLSLWAGKPARIVRAEAEKTRVIKNARISFFGGVQPETWRRMFSGKNNLYQEDGTLFRFLLTYEGDDNCFPLLTSEAWTDENRALWEYTLKAAMKWADERGSNKNYLDLDGPAGDLFFEWRNELYSWKGKLPPIVQGFIPKLISYTLRLAGVLYCMTQFVQGQEPEGRLGLVEIAAGIKAAEFYMTNAVDASEILKSETPIKTKIEPTGQLKQLIETLLALRSEVDRGYLAVGYIYDRYQEKCSTEHRIANERALGQLLRGAGFNMSDKGRRANGREHVRCLIWDKKTNNIINNMSPCPQVPDHP